MSKRHSVKSLVEKAMVDSLRFSRENSDQIFFSIHPHVSMAVFYAYQGGWANDKERVFTISIYYQGNLSPTLQQAKKILKPIYDFINQSRS